MSRNRQNLNIKEGNVKVHTTYYNGKELVWGTAEDCILTPFSVKVSGGSLPLAASPKGLVAIYRGEDGDAVLSAEWHWGFNKVMRVDNPFASVEEENSETATAVKNAVAFARKA